jgi:hypothetical protein
MQSVELTIKPATGEPMVLVFAAGDAPEIIAERLRMVTWIVRQVSGQPAEPKRRPRVERETTPGDPPSREGGQ